jgi:hypothetical protein
VSQLLLIPNPRPLDERLGDDFFRKALNSFQNLQQNSQQHPSVHVI